MGHIQNLDINNLNLKKYSSSKRVKHLGSTRTKNEELDVEIFHRMGWTNWERATEMLYNKRMDIRIKGKSRVNSSKTSVVWVGNLGK